MKSLAAEKPILRIGQEVRTRTGNVRWKIISKAGEYIKNGRPAVLLQALNPPHQYRIAEADKLRPPR